MKNNRIYFDLTTLGLTASEWKERLTKNGHKIGDWANDVLSKPDFDENHRYQPGQTLKVVLVRGKEIQKGFERTTQNLKAIAVKDFGQSSVSELKGELSLLIREKFSNKDLEEMDLFYIVTLHEPIIVSGGYPCVLRANRVGGGSWVDANWDNPDNYWYGFGAFAFLQSQS